MVLLALFALAPLMANAAPAGAAPTKAGDTGNVSQPAKVKELPTAPPQAPNITTAPLASKPTSGGANTNLAWSVTLTASPTVLWPYQYSTLTATANQDVGPTPYYIRIYDLQAHAFIATCGFGTTCTAYVTRTTSGTRYYRAIVATWTSTYPSTVQAQSADVVVHWRSLSVSLAATPTTTVVGGYVHLVATTDTDVGPTPFYIEIYDATTGVRLTACGFGTTCSVYTTQSVATTHQFVAYVSLWSTAFPPLGLQATSNTSFVTWTSSAFRISLGLAPGPTSGVVTATATTNLDVGPTVYWIEIFNLNTGVRIGVCGFGTSCSANFTPGPGRTDIVAFVSSLDTNLPPANIQASSSVETVWLSPLSARLRFAPLDK